jgi:hypothetical protein
VGSASGMEPIVTDAVWKGAELWGKRSEKPWWTAAVHSRRSDVNGAGMAWEMDLFSANRRVDMGN